MTQHRHDVGLDELGAVVPTRRGVILRCLNWCVGILDAHDTARSHSFREIQRDTPGAETNIQHTHTRPQAGEEIRGTIRRAALGMVSEDRLLVAVRVTVGDRLVLQLGWSCRRIFGFFVWYVRDHVAMVVPHEQSLYGVIMEHRRETLSAIVAHARIS